MRTVALRKESVDRNNDTTTKKKINPVALRKESVDRNDPLETLVILPKQVALRKESVDRNIQKIAHLCLTPVALRKESVDRNFVVVSLNYKEVLSLSARRAWIEMLLLTYHLEFGIGRSPQGERG